MSQNRTIICSRWDCTAVLDLETAVVLYWDDSAEAVGLCPCCATKEGY